MVSFQVDFQIKDNTYMMIQDGTLKISDGVVRWAEGDKKGQIYEIIKFDDISESDSDEIEKIANSDYAELDDEDIKTSEVAECFHRIIDKRKKVKMERLSKAQ